MKHFLIASAIAFATQGAVAQPFDFQRQIGSSEYVWDADTAGMHFVPVSADHGPSAYTRWLLSANVDGIAPNRFVGKIVPSGPTRISLYEIQRDSPEGIAYRGYHARFPADTDWARVAREYREQRLDQDLAADVRLKSDDS